MCCSKWFSTGVTFVIRLAFMNSFHMFLPSMLHKKMICCKIHIRNLCGLHELCGHVFSNFLHEKRICHKIHVCDLCGLHELCGYVPSNVLLEKMVYHKIHIYNLCSLHELCEYMCLQMSCLRKWYITRFTFVIFVAFMNCVDVIFQRSCFRK